MGSKLRFITSVLTHLLAAYHCYLIYVVHHEYQTVTTTEFLYLENIIPTKYHFCYKFKQFEGYFAATTDVKLLALGPSEKEFVTSCQSYLTKENYSSNCNSTLHVKKYLKHQQVCYLILLRYEPNEMELLGSHTDQRKFKLQLNDTTFRRSSQSRLMISIYVTDTEYGLHGSVNPSANIVVKKVQENNRTMYENGKIYVDYHKRCLQLLPAPYTTNCMDYSSTTSFKNETYHSRSHCFDTCIDYMSDEAKLIMPSSFWSNSKNYTVMVEADLRNVSVYSNYSRIQRYCNQQCPKVDCIQHIFTPYIKKSPISDTIELLLGPSTTLTERITHSPKISDLEYLSLTMSAFGVWLGISVLKIIHGLQSASNYAIKHFFKLRGLYDLEDNDELGTLRQRLQDIEVQNDVLKTEVFEQSIVIRNIMQRLGTVEITSIGQRRTTYISRRIENVDRWSRDFGRRSVDF